MLVLNQWLPVSHWQRISYWAFKDLQVDFFDPGSNKRKVRKIELFTTSSNFVQIKNIFQNFLAFFSWISVLR